MTDTSCAKRKGAKSAQLVTTNSEVAASIKTKEDETCFIQ